MGNKPKTKLRMRRGVHHERAGQGNARPAQKRPCVLIRLPSAKHRVAENLQASCDGQKKSGHRTSSLVSDQNVNRRTPAPSAVLPVLPGVMLTTVPFTPDWTLTV